MSDKIICYKYYAVKVWLAIQLWENVILFSNQSSTAEVEIQNQTGLIVKTEQDRTRNILVG